MIDDLTRFINDFSEYLNVIGGQRQKLDISGDTNTNLLKLNKNQHFNYFYDNIIMQGFIPHNITLPTKLSDNYDTLINNILANNVGVNHVNGVLSHAISDYQITFSIVLGSIYAHSLAQFNDKKYVLIPMKIVKLSSVKNKHIPKNCANYINLRIKEKIA